MTGLFREGGLILWVIAGSGLLAFIVFIERALHLHRARIKSEDFLKGIFNILKRGNVNEALTICDETPGPVAYLVRMGILHRNDTADAMRSALEDAAVSEVSRMERRLVVIATVAQIAPLMGLLGTVLGMVNALILMRNDIPYIQTVGVIDGLMLALVSTGAGLLVAIPCYAAFNMLVVKIDRIVLDMERAAADVVAFFGTGRDL